jgi:hypothetical protein
MQTTPIDRRQDMSVTSTEARASEEGQGSAGLAAYLVTVELRGDGEPRRVALVCEARSRSLAKQIAWDVNEDEPHVYILGVRRIGELQVIHPLAWDARRGLIREAE